MSIERRLGELGLTLPTAPRAMATYATAVRHGDLIYVAGTGPLRHDGSYMRGRLGAELDVAAGQAAARLAGLAMLATLRAQLGSLDRVARVVKLLGLVQATPEFADHPAVINGCSDLLVQLFGENGLGARSALGVASLPQGIAVEIEGIFAVTDGDA